MPSVDYINYNLKLTGGGVYLMNKINFMFICTCLSTSLYIIIYYGFIFYVQMKG